MSINNDHIKNLLLAAKERINIVKGLQSKLERDFSPNANILKIIKPDEPELSSLFAYLLNPNGSHGFERNCLKKFILLINNNKSRIPDLESAWYLAASSRTEVWLDNHSRIDILIEDPGRTFCLGIENKPWASKQPNQIGRYLHALDERCPSGYHLVYVVSKYTDEKNRKDGVFGPRTSNEGNLSIQTYEEFMIDWLRLCEKEAFSDRTRYLVRSIREYVEYVFAAPGNRWEDGMEKEAIMNLVMQDMPTFEAAQAVRSGLNNAERMLLRNMYEILTSRIEKKVKGCCKDVFVESDWVNGDFKNWSGITLHDPSWPECVDVRIEAQRGGMYNLIYGVRVRKDIDSCERTQIYEKIKYKRQDLYLCTSSYIWPAYCHANECEMVDDSDILRNAAYVYFDSDNATEGHEALECLTEKVVSLVKMFDEFALFK